jgi:hypothetical protein
MLVIRVTLLALNTGIMACDLACLLGGVVLYVRTLNPGMTMQ